MAKPFLQIRQQQLKEKLTAQMDENEFYVRDQTRARQAAINIAHRIESLFVILQRRISFESSYAPAIQYHLSMISRLQRDLSHLSIEHFNVLKRNLENE